MIKKLKVTDGMQAGQLATACEMIREGNAMLAAGKKKADAGKQAILHWLETERGMKETSLNIGDIVTVEGETGEMLKLEIRGKNRLNQEFLQVNFPEAFAGSYQLFAEKNFSILMESDRLASMRVKLSNVMDKALDAIRNLHTGK